MFAKLVVVACSVAVSYAAWNGPLAGGQPASLYPAGIDPQACPNFPNCENPAVALSGTPSAHAYKAIPAQQQWNNAPAHNPTQQWNSAPVQKWNAAPVHEPAPQWNAAPAPQWNPTPAPKWNAAPAPQWNPTPAPKWNSAPAPQWTPTPAPKWNVAPVQNSYNQALNSGEYTGDGDYHGEGLAESGAFGPVQSGNQAYSTPSSVQKSGYAHHTPQGVAQVPAGVDAHSCPNYPFCN